MNWFFIALGLISGIVSASSFIPYIRSILKGQTKPSIATWLVWTVVGGMTLASYVAAGGWTTTVWGAIVYVVAPFIVLILAFKFGKKGDVRVNRVEKACFIGAGLGILVWFFTKSAAIGLLFFLLADFMGAIPTMVKSYYYPYEEDLFAWTLSLAGGTLNLFALENFSFEVASQPIYLFLSVSITTLIIFIGQKRAKRKI